MSVECEPAIQPYPKPSGRLAVEPDLLLSDREPYPPTGF